MTISKQRKTNIFRSIILSVISLSITTFFLVEDYNKTITYDTLNSLKKDLEKKNDEFVDLENAMKNIEKKYSYLKNAMVDSKKFENDFSQILQKMNKLSIFNVRIQSINNSYIKGYEAKGVKENVLEITLNVNPQKVYLSNEEASVLFLHLFKDLFKNNSMFREYRYKDNIVKIKYIKKA